jgi:hypothetical protein
MCQTCGRRFQKYGTTDLPPKPPPKNCSYQDCRRQYYAKDWCRVHYRQMTDRGWVGPIRIRKQNGQARFWKGGYIYVTDPRNPSKVIPEHHLVMEISRGRRLHPWENVHHKNGRVEDNSLSNLELWCKPQPAGQRVEDLLNWLVSSYPSELRQLLS